jgi:hypothetical protein
MFDILSVRVVFLKIEVRSDLSAAGLFHLRSSQSFGCAAHVRQPRKQGRRVDHPTTRCDRRSGLCGGSVMCVALIALAVKVRQNYFAGQRGLFARSPVLDFTFSLPSFPRKDLGRSKDFQRTLSLVRNQSLLRPQSVR